MFCTKLSCYMLEVCIYSKCLPCLVLWSLGWCVHPAVLILLCLVHSVGSVCSVYLCLVLTPCLFVF